jgi:hypothetical protein
LAASDVFINCPFDDEYEPLLGAIVFAIRAAGYNPRCALEDNDGANIRFDKLRKIISECPRSVHDLSRTNVPQGEMPRFNMPFELGLAMGKKYFGGRSARNNSALIMIQEPYVLPRYLSDLAGNDPTAHEGDVAKVIGIVTDYLVTDPAGDLLPGADLMRNLFQQFLVRLPIMAEEAERRIQEVSPLTNFRPFCVLLDAFLRIARPKQD